MFGLIAMLFKYTTVRVLPINNLLCLDLKGQQSIVLYIPNDRS